MNEPTTPEEDEEFNRIERESKIRQEYIRSLKPKTQQEVYDELRNDILEQVAYRIEHDDIFGNASAVAVYIRNMKK